MTNDQTFVIVGASLAGAKAAETLRIGGFDGQSGEAARETIHVHDEGFYAEHDIDLRLGRTLPHGDQAVLS